MWTRVLKIKKKNKCGFPMFSNPRYEFWQIHARYSHENVWTSITGCRAKPWFPLLKELLLRLFRCSLQSIHLLSPRKFQGRIGFELGSECFFRYFFSLSQLVIPPINGIWTLNLHQSAASSTNSPRRRSNTSICRAIRKVLFFVFSCLFICMTVYDILKKCKTIGYLRTPGSFPPKIKWITTTGRSVFTSWQPDAFEGASEATGVKNFGNDGKSHGIWKIWLSTFCKSSQLRMENIKKCD